MTRWIHTTTRCQILIGMSVAMTHGTSAEKKMIWETDTTPMTKRVTSESTSAAWIAGRNISTMPREIALPASTGSAICVTHVKGTKIQPSQSKIGVYFASSRPMSPTERIEGRIAAAM